MKLAEAKGAVRKTNNNIAIQRLAGVADLFLLPTHMDGWGERGHYSFYPCVHMHCMVEE